MWLFDVCTIENRSLLVHTAVTCVVLMVDCHLHTTRVSAAGTCRAMITEHPSILYLYPHNVISTVLSFNMTFILSHPPYAWQGITEIFSWCQLQWIYYYIHIPHLMHGNNWNVARYARNVFSNATQLWYCFDAIPILCMTTVNSFLAALTIPGTPSVLWSIVGNLVLLFSIV